MDEVRPARKDEIARQKEIWKLCFGDSDSYIDFYYANRYKEAETLLLLHDDKISAMLTMLPVRIVSPDERSFDSAMVYAIATHPECRNSGFATKLIDFSSCDLNADRKEVSILVPAGERLFDFYRKQGFQEGFYVREALLTRDRVEGLAAFTTSGASVSPAAADEYNRRRNSRCTGRLHVAYSNEDIAYQKKLSRQSGADIYAIDMGETQGCAAIERVSSDKVLIKEVLGPEELVPAALKQIAQQLDAKEYIVRTPAYSGESLGGSLRPFGMFRVNREIDFELTPGDFGYIGLAFD